MAAEDFSCAWCHRTALIERSMAGSIIAQFSVQLVLDVIDQGCPVLYFVLFGIIVASLAPRGQTLAGAQAGRSNREGDTGASSCRSR